MSTNTGRFVLIKEQTGEGWAKAWPDTVRQQCEVAIPANIAAQPFGMPGMIVELLDRAELEEPAVKEWNPVAGA